jgi:protein-tyrosine phosphatase
MCDMAAADGIKSVAVTPHLLRLNRHGDDLGLLRRRMIEFTNEMAGVPLDFHWGAEVAAHSDLVGIVERHGFTVDATSYLFIEFPGDSVPPGAANLLYDLMRKGFVPILSHPERNRGFVEHPDLLCEFVRMGCVGQVTAGSLTGAFGRDAQRAAELFLTHNLVHVIASDAHDGLARPPILSRGVEAAARLAGAEKAWAMVTEIPQAILDNGVLPDWGEPEDPLARRPATERLASGRPRTSFLFRIR